MTQREDTDRFGPAQEGATDSTPFPQSGGRVRGAFRGLVRHRPAIFGLIVLLVFVLSAILGPSLLPHDPVAPELPDRLLPPLSRGVNGELYVLGTDPLGRDVLSRIVYGSRISLGVSFSSVAISAALGVFLGVISGYYGGPIGALINRVTELQLVFPFILLAMAIVALLGPSARNLVLVFSLTSWPVYTRVVRASVLSLREMEFVLAARAVGSGHGRIMVNHILPNVSSLVTVVGSFQVAQMVILESGVGFLGLGVPPPTPTWGTMLADSRGYVQIAWWVVTFPGLAIMLMAGATNFIGDALRDVLDPRARTT